MSESSHSTIAVDLTPVLPGGENGGAKFLAIELARRLAATRPTSQFVILTQAASHDELATLDASNVRRLQVVGASASALRPTLFGTASRMLATAPASVTRLAAKAGYRVNAMMKRGGRRVLREVGAQLLFCPFTAPTYREAGVATVCTINDLQFQAYPQFFAPEDVVQRERACRDACEHATALTAISSYTRESTIAYAGLEPSRVRTIHLRLSRDWMNAGSRPSPIAGDFLLYPANFWKHKNHEMLLTAFSMARKSGLADSVKLVFTGAPGTRQTWITEAARRMDLADRVVFAGFLPQEDLVALTRACRAVVFPSLYEGFGLPVVEAMAACVPVACSNTTALPEVAGDAALLFDPRLPAEMAQAIVRICKDEALRSQLIAAGKRRAVEFSDADRMAADYWEVFDGALRVAQPSALR